MVYRGPLVREGLRKVLLEIAENQKGIIQLMEELSGKDAVFEALYKRLGGDKLTYVDPERLRDALVLDNARVYPSVGSAECRLCANQIKGRDGEEGSQDVVDGRSKGGSITEEEKVTKNSDEEELSSLQGPNDLCSKHYQPEMSRYERYMGIQKILERRNRSKRSKDDDVGMAKSEESTDGGKNSAEKRIEEESAAEENMRVKIEALLMTEVTNLMSDAMRLNDRKNDEEKDSLLTTLNKEGKVEVENCVEIAGDKKINVLNIKMEVAVEKDSTSECEK